MKKKRIPAALGVALVLLCLVLVTAHFTTGMYARFTTRSGGYDSGRVASFRVSATSAPKGPVEITPSTENVGTYTVTLSNSNKEIPVRYYVDVSFDDEADAWIPVTVDKPSGQIAPGIDEIVVVTFDMDGFSGGGTAPFTVVVTFTQID